MVEAHAAEGNFCHFGGGGGGGGKDDEDEVFIFETREGSKNLVLLAVEFEGCRYVF